MPFLDRLKPDEAEIRQAALRETDPRFATEFEPFTKGPLAALLILAAVGIAAVPLTVWRLLTKKNNF
jgi:hypothetical protein